MRQKEALRISLSFFDTMTTKYLEEIELNVTNERYTTIFLKDLLLPI